MAIDVSKRARKDMRDLLDTPLLELQNERGWRRVIDIYSTDASIAVPNYSELCSFLQTGTESNAESHNPYGDNAYVARSNQRDLVETWTAHFVPFDNSFDYVLPTGVIHRTEGSFPNVLSRTRLSAPEIAVMDMAHTDGWGTSTGMSGKFIYDQPGVDPRESAPNQKLASIFLYNPEYTNQQLTPLQASTMLYEINSTLWRAFYLGNVTFGELLGVMHRQDEMRYYLPEWGEQNHEVWGYSLRFGALVRDLRGKVPAEDLITWAHLAYDLAGTAEQAISLANLTSASEALKFVEKGADSLLAISNFIEYDIDFGMSSAITKASV